MLDPGALKRVQEETPAEKLQTGDELQFSEGWRAAERMELDDSPYDSSSSTDNSEEGARSPDLAALRKRGSEKK
jgi:hypothetical protein